jgi:hypothetical protein
MHQMLRFLCLAATIATVAAAQAAEPGATSYSLTCNIRGATTTGASGDIRGDGVTTHPTRTSSSQSVTKIEVSTQPKAVVMQLQSGSSTDSDGVTQPYQPEGPRYIEDVRVLTPTMLVFCDDANGCRPQDKSGSNGSRSRVETSPVTVNLADGSIGYRSGASITGGNGSMLYSRTEYIGTCSKGG